MESEEDVPRLLSLAWGVAVAPQRGPKRELTHERIVEVAIEIADAEGLQAVTMQRVAKTFGFTTMAMYRYVASKDDLNQLMADAITPAGAWAIDARDWHTGLAEWVRILTDAYRRHPWALELPVSHQSMLMPGSLRAADAGLRAMRSLRAAPEEKLTVITTLTSLVRGLAAVLHGRGNGAVNAATRGLVASVVADAHLGDIETAVRSGAYFDDAQDDPSIAWSLVAAGIENSFGTRPDAPPPTRPERTPEEALGDAQAELEQAVALRKAAQKRVNELVKAEGKARAERDAAKATAKEAAKAAAKEAARGAARQAAGRQTAHTGRAGGPNGGADA